MPLEQVRPVAHGTVLEHGWPDPGFAVHVVPTQLLIVVSQQPPPQATLDPEQVRQSVPALLHPFAHGVVD
jgi:hypothetical protein